MRFTLDTWLLAGLLMLVAIAGGRIWLDNHPRYDPWAPLSLDDSPDAWATRTKIGALRGDPAECRAFLMRSAIAFEQLDPVGEGTCRRDDRQILKPGPSSGPSSGLDLRPSGAQATCAIDAALVRWLRHGIQPTAEAILGSRVVRIEHLGTNNCRRIGGGDSGSWSEHATGNAIDISAFVLADGRRISVRRDWAGNAKPSAYLHAVRDSACQEFATVLSPDYNAAHADHLHLDQAQRGGGWSSCH